MQGFLHPPDKSGFVFIRVADMETAAQARIERINDTIVARFHERMEDGASMETTLTIAINDDPYVHFRREGAIVTDYTFALAGETAGFYAMPEGRLPLTVVTRRLVVRESPSGVHVELEAQMVFAHEQQLDVEAEIDVSWQTPVS